MLVASLTSSSISGWRRKSLSSLMTSTLLRCASRAAGGLLGVATAVVAGRAVRRQPQRGSPGGAVVCSPPSAGRPIAATSEA